MISVPLEPTEAMKAAGLRQWIDQKEMDVAAIWSAMCAAAPSPAGGGEEAWPEREKDIAWLERQREVGHCGESTSDAIYRGRLDDRIDRILAALSHPVSPEDRGSLPAAAQPSVPTEQAETPVVGDERLKWFLHIIDAAGGTAPAGDSYGVMDAFCYDRGDQDDTYNLSEGLGLTRTVHSGWADGCATVEITDAGRARLAELSAPAVAPSGGA